MFDTFSLIDLSITLTTNLKEKKRLDLTTSTRAIVSNYLITKLKFNLMLILTNYIDYGHHWICA